ncbi:Gfo/Idh/MocA family oxidoreductase [Rheinheimera sp.]|uniref:Gfo/Idh/MocA family protein n=1 Tax=Rheinheimera sp. TaxID=1869214 RepID=UPI00307FCCE6
MTRLRIGLLGASRIAEKAILQPAALLASDVEVRAVGASSAAKAQAYAQQYQLAAWEGSYQALLQRDDIDLIYNALPASLHAQWSIKALQAGKSVLCEKPFALNAAEVSSMLSAAEQSGQLLLEGYHYRFHPVFLKVQQLLQSGVLGKLLTVRSNFSVRIAETPGSLRHQLALGGGALMDLGCYPLHWVRQLLGNELQLLQAAAICHTQGVDESFSARLLGPAGEQIYLGCSMAEHLNRQHDAYLELLGEQGKLEVFNLVAPHQGHQIRLELNGQSQTEQLEAESTYYYQLKHWLDCLRGQATPLTGGQDALQQMQWIDRLYLAAGLPTR